jgi:hypothetical protein
MPFGWGGSSAQSGGGGSAALAIPSPDGVYHPRRDGRAAPQQQGGGGGRGGAQQGGRGQGGAVAAPPREPTKVLDTGNVSVTYHGAIPDYIKLIKQIHVKPLVGRGGAPGVGPWWGVPGWAAWLLLRWGGARPGAPVGAAARGAARRGAARLLLLPPPPQNAQPPPPAPPPSCVHTNRCSPRRVRSARARAGATSTSRCARRCSAAPSSAT